MTREDMIDIIAFYLHSADSKSILECTNIDVSRCEIEDFLKHAAGTVTYSIGKGTFDV